MAPTAEDRLTAWLRRLAPGGELIGDDVASLGLLADAVVTVDQQIAGTHYPADLDPAVVARRLLEVNLSDLAAAGARPVFAVLALAAPPSFDHRRFLGALTSACRKRQVRLVGGDTARADTACLSLTMLGERPPHGRHLLRSAVRTGDRFWLGGSVGESVLGRHLVDRGARIAGRRVVLPPPFDHPEGIRRAAARAVRRHLEPRAQLELGEWLGRRKRAAAIDISDGLALDLTRLCEASGVGARIDLDSLPVADRFDQLLERLGLAAEACALGGGEDYVLLFALPPRVSPPAAFGCTAIGRATGDGDLLAERDGQEAPLEPRGWSHL